MLCQCISLNQKDWVSKLPAIDFAINLARSETTSYTPFFLNTSCMPCFMIWNDPNAEEFAGVWVYTQHVKQVVISAHNSILAARVKQAHDANKKCCPTPFV